MSDQVDILDWPHPTLCQRAHPVTTFDATLLSDIELMWRVMYDAPGIGLAAPQIGDPRRMFVMDCQPRSPEAQPLVYINPILSEFEGSVDSVEGCLSLPGLTVTVPRAERLKICAQDATGAHFEVSLTGIEAICAQHEYDHLEGRSFLELLDPVMRAEALHEYLAELCRIEATLDTPHEISETIALVRPILASTLNQAVSHTS